jgi:hypothetical protein
MIITYKYTENEVFWDDTVCLVHSSQYSEGSLSLHIFPDNVTLQIKAL